MISPYRFFKIYSAVQYHFISNYDFFKYGGKTNNLTKDIFNGRIDTSRFEIISKKFDDIEIALKYCVFNFLYDEQWLYNSFDEAKDRYLNSIKFYSNFTENINKEYEVINKRKDVRGVSFIDITKPTRSGNKPPILQMFYQHTISIEFICIANMVDNFISSWSSSLDPLVKSDAIKIEKYSPFVKLFNK